MTSNHHIHHADAVALLNRLEPIVLARGEPLQGYQLAAELIGRDTTAYPSKHNTHMGQVCSRLDLAAFTVGLPLLALHWVRKLDGEMNTGTFAGELWSGQWRDVMIQRAASHVWVEEEIARLRAALFALPEEAGRLQWRAIEAREYLEPGFIQQQVQGGTA